MVTKKEVGITLQPLALQLLEITVIGDSPLIVHAWSAKAKREMLGKQMKKAQGAKAAKDPKADFENSLYRFPHGGYGFPSVAFKTAAVTAGTSVAGLTKIAARQAFHILGDDVEVAGAFEGSTSRANLIRIEGGTPIMREDMVKVGMGTADLRYRGEFANWHAKLLIKYNANVLSEEQIMNLINVAGFAVGIGEWRPERDGSSGMFHVASDKDMEAIERRAA